MWLQLSTGRGWHGFTRVCVWFCAQLWIPVMLPSTSPCSPQSRQRSDPSTQRCPSPPLPVLIAGRYSSQVISTVYSHWLVFRIVLPFLECTLSGMRQQVTFWSVVLFFKLSKMPRDPTSCCVYRQPVFFTPEQWRLVWMSHGLFNHSRIWRHFGCFHILGITNEDAVDIHAQMCGHSSHFSGMNAQDWALWVYSKYVFTKYSFFFKETPKLLPSMAVSLYLPTGEVQGSGFSTLSRAFGADAGAPLLRVVSTRFYQWFVCPLLCGDPMGHDVERLFMCLFAICISSQVKFLCIFCPFSTGIVLFLLTVTVP